MCAYCTQGCVHLLQLQVPKKQPCACLSFTASVSCTEKGVNHIF